MRFGYDSTASLCNNCILWYNWKDTMNMVDVCTKWPESTVQKLARQSDIFYLFPPLQWCAMLLTAMSWGVVWSSGCRLRSSQTAGLSRDPTSLTSCSNTSRWASFLCRKKEWTLVSVNAHNLSHTSLFLEYSSFVIRVGLLQPTWSLKPPQTASNYSCDRSFKRVWWT